jgi:hypothetical protein
MRLISTLLTGFLIMGASLSAQAQQPDTIRVKEQLPTGLPGEGLPQQNQQRVPPPAPSRTAPPRTQAPAPAPGPTPETRGLNDRLYIAGNTGLNLFGGTFFVDVSPMVGYKLSDKFSLGPGVVYHYVSQRGLNYSNYGVKGFARFLVLPVLFAHVEHELLNVPYTYSQSLNGRLQVESRRNVNSTLAGLGYRQRVSDRFAMDTMVLANLQPSDFFSLYRFPVIRFGFYFDL